MVGTRAAIFSGCAVIPHWLPHTPVQIFFSLLLVHKKVWCSLSSSSIQTGVLCFVSDFTYNSNSYKLHVIVSYI